VVNVDEVVKVWLNTATNVVFLVFISPLLCVGIIRVNSIAFDADSTDFLL